MKTTYKILIVVGVVLFSIILITGFLILASSTYSDVNECWYDDGEGNMLPCKIDTGLSWWPFPVSPKESTDCDELCFDSSQEDLDVRSVEVIIPRGAVIDGSRQLIPEEITVVLGKNNTVTWINHDEVAHGIVSDDNSWGSPGVLRPEDSFSVTFNSTGTYGYHGMPPPWMTGKVIVLDELYEDSLVDPTSSFIKEIMPTLEDFRKFLSESPDIDTIFYRFGEPHSDIGSGIHIYVYKLNDSTEVWIGYADRILYVQHVDSDGIVLEQLL